MNELQIFGRKGENIAALFLQKHGYKIVERNFKCKQGEIDIIAKQKNQYIFIEVKTRKSLKYGMPSESVNKTKQNHIKKVAQYYICTNKISNFIIRFDIIEIYLKNGKYQINHLKQAFY